MGDERWVRFDLRDPVVRDRGEQLRVTSVVAGERGTEHALLVRCGDEDRER
jgi:hypothetical protein